MNPKKKKYNDEILRIKQLSAINKVLKKGDVENAFLNNTDKDIEPIKDSAVEHMLEELDLGKDEAKELQMVDSLVTGRAPPSYRPNKSYKSKPSRKAQARKRPMPKKKAHKKAQSRAKR